MNKLQLFNPRPDSGGANEPLEKFFWGTGRSTMRLLTWERNVPGRSLIVTLRFHHCPQSTSAPLDVLRAAIGQNSPVPT